MKRAFRTIWLASFSLALAVQGSTLAAADETDAPPQPLRYRRMYVPADRIDDWPRDAGVRYRPMPKADFERLVEQFKRTTSETSSVAVRVVAAHYQATLRDDLLRGEATLEIVRSEPEMTAKTDSADPGSLLVLEPCGLAVHAARWTDADGPPATFGIDNAGQTAVLVQHSGQLVIEWSLRGNRAIDKRLLFDFHLPKSVRSSLDLSLPDGTTATASHGAVIDAPKAGGMRGGWRLELGGNHEFTLTIAESAGRSESQRQALVRQTATYTFLPRGLELTVQLTIDVGKEPLRHLELSMDPQLRPLAIRQGESSVPWTIATEAGQGPDPDRATDAAAEAQRVRILLELPQPIAGPGNILRLAATAPMKLAETWRLPDVRTAGLFWQEGRSTLLFPKPLMLQRLSTKDCRQTSTGPLPPPSEGETIGLQCFVPESTVEVVVAHARQALRVASAAVMELAEDSIHARETAELRLSDGQIFSLQGEVSHEWTIDAVESIPPGSVKDWSLVNPSARKRRLEIQLNQAISGGTPLRLVVSGHRLNPSLADPVTMAQLRFVEWNDSTLGVRVMSLRSPDNYRLKLRGEQSLQRLHPQQLPDEIESLVTEPVEGLTFLVDAQAAGLEIALERHAPQYTAELAVEAVATPGPLWETYTLLCRPQNSRVERVVVHFSHARSEPPRWSLGSEGEAGVTAQRKVDEAERKEAPQTGETWELTLKRPRSTPFEIRATRAVPFGQESLPISLISLPEADSQHGELSVRVTPAAIVGIENHSLAPQSIDSQDTRRGQRNSVLRASYRFVPSHDGLAVSPPAIALKRQDSGEVVVGSLAWRATLQSRYDPTGNAYHVAAWQLQNEDRARITLQVPDEARDVALWIDDKRLSVQIRDGACDIELPTGRAFPTLTATFRTPAPAFHILTHLTPPQPHIDLPVLANQWIVWLPPGYEMPGVTTGTAAGALPFDAMERLFGPLARSAGDRALLALDGWTSLAGAGHDQDRQRLRQIIEQLGVGLPAGAVDSARYNWGWLLERLETHVEANGLTLLVDVGALAETGLTPDRPLDDPGASSAWQRGVERLRQADLMLLLDDHAVLLSTMAAAALDRSQFTPLDNVVTARVRRAALHEALEQAVEQRGSSRFHLAGQWVAEPALPWTSRQAPLDPADVYGWSAYSLDLATSMSTYVVRRAAIDVLGWGLMLLIVVLGWRSSMRPAPLIAMTAAAMVAALLLPAMFAPLATSVALGLLFCLALQALRPRRSIDRSTHSAQALVVSDNMPTTAGVLALVLLAAISNCGRAEESAPPAHKIFIPTDALDQFTGEHYWVPEAFYTRLQRDAAETAQAPRGWLLEAAEYRAEGSWDVAQQRLIIPEIKCNFDLQVFEPDGRVVLPLASGQSMPPAQTVVLLDGREIVAQWGADGQSLAFDVPDAGHYRVQLALRPAISVEQGVSSIDLAIPALAVSRLELHLPRTSPVLEVPSARGIVELTSGGQQMLVHLGDAPRLTLQWRDGAAGRNLHPVVEADQLVWMHIQPGSVTADVKIQFRVLEGSVRTLQLALDPRWQLQPGDESQPPVTQVRGAAGAPQLLQFELPHPVSDQMTIEASLRLAGASGVGNYRLPYLQPLEVRSARHWLALSVDGALAYRENGAEPLTSLSAAEFSAQWTGEEPPQQAYRLPSSLPDWSVAVRPGAVHKVADTALAVSVAPEHAAVRFEAAIESSGPSFQHRVVAPAELAIESIAVIEDEVDRLAHWSRDAHGTLTLFLNELATGPQQLVIKASMALPRRGPWNLPLLRVDDAEFRSGQVRIYRQPQQVVTVRNSSGLAEQPEEQRAIENQNPELEKRFAGMGRIVRLYEMEEHAYSATLVCSSNRPTFKAAQITAVRRDAGQWQAEVDCRIDVTSGIVDLLRFDIPSTWQGPFQVTPPATATLSEVTSDGGRQLILRPFAPVTGEYHLKLSGPVTPPAGAPLEAPAISLAGAARLSQILLLPTQWELQPVTWETRGLIRIDAETATDERAGLKGVEAFRVIDSSYSAELKPAVRPAGRPQVYLADISFTCNAGGQVQGVASFDLDPAGHGGCTLHVPDACRLLQVLVNGTPATLGRQTAGQWHVGLGSDQLAQRIEVLFISQLDAQTLDRGAWRLVAPHLGELEVQRSLWTVYGPQQWQLAAGDAARRSSALRQELERLRSIASLLNLTPAVLPSDLADDLEAWYAPWSRRYVASLSAVRQELLRTRDGELARTIGGEVRRIEQQQLDIARKLAMPESLLRVDNDTLAAEQSRQIWQSASVLHPAGVRLASSEAAPEIVLEPAAPLAAEWARRGLWSLAVLAVAGAVIALHRSHWWERVVAWRCALGVALGFGWWLWLSPPALGWMIAAASLLAAFRERRRPHRELGSSVIRLGTSTHG